MLVTSILLLFPQCFLPFTDQTSTFRLHVFCCLQMLSVWTKFHHLVELSYKLLQRHCPFFFFFVPCIIKKSVRACEKVHFYSFSREAGCSQVFRTKNTYIQILNKFGMICGEVMFLCFYYQYNLILNSTLLSDLWTKSSLKQTVHVKYCN